MSTELAVRPTDMTAGADEEAREDASKPSTLEAEGQLRILKSWWEDDSRHSSTWRKEAREDFDFVGGKQFSTEDEQALKDSNRVPVVFNRALTMIKAVSGMEINGRHEISYLPRNNEDSKVNEVLTGASKWMADECDGEDEESEGFEHVLICGMGWGEHRMDFEEEPEGKYIEQAIDPLEMFWDRNARKKNLADARRIHRVRKMPLGDAMSLFPDHSAEELDAVWAKNTGSNEPDKTLEERRVRNENVTDFPDRSEVTIVQVQWWEREVYWLIADPQTNTKAQLPDAQYKVLKKRAAMIGLKFHSVRMVKRVYKQAFIGSKVLECGDAPIPDRFSFTCVTGQINHNKGTWFGLIRVMRDPAMWSNKFLVQTMHIMNSNAKGGIMAEPDAFEDQAQAERSYARPESITWMKKGSLSGANPKFAKKPSAEMPQGFMELMGVAIDAMKDVTGINLELLGLKDVNQPGVLEAQRKQAGMTVLATMFDSLRRSRKMIGRIRLYFIQNFLSDGRLIRITGPDGAQVIPLIRDKTLGNYDVVVDDTPSSPNQKQANWAIIQPMLVTFKDQLMSRPDIFAMLLDFSPLPSRVVEAVKAAILQPSQQQVEGAELAKQKTLAAIGKDVSIAQMNDAKAGATQVTAMLDFAMANHLRQKDAVQMQDGGHPMQPHLDAAHTAAQIGTEQAKADQIRAQTGQAVANTDKTHADAHASRIGALIDALQPIPHAPPLPAGAA
jgi:hypothetical protein